MTADYISEHDRQHICSICCDIITCRGCAVWRRAEEREKEARETDPGKEEART